LSDVTSIGTETPSYHDRGGGGQAAREPPVDDATPRTRGRLLSHDGGRCNRSMSRKRPGPSIAALGRPARQVLDIVHENFALPRRRRCCVYRGDDEPELFARAQNARQPETSVPPGATVCGSRPGLRLSILSPLACYSFSPRRYSSREAGFGERVVPLVIRLEKRSRSTLRVLDTDAM
jgi:hypothetical protein